MSLLSRVGESGTIPLLEKVVSFSDARHKMLVENIANIDTPGYRTQQLDVGEFQAELRRAANARKSDADEFCMKSTRQVQVNANGGLEVRPELEPPENLTFHDGTNTHVERQMSALADNAAAHQLAVELLRANYAQLMTAIKGRVV